jgi:hypothetical protein
MMKALRGMAVAAMVSLFFSSPLFAQEKVPPAENGISVQVAMGENAPTADSDQWRSVEASGVEIEVAKPNVWIRANSGKDGAWIVYGPLNDGDTVAISAHGTTYLVPITFLEVDPSAPGFLGFRIKVRIRVVIGSGGGGGGGGGATKPPPVYAGLEADPTQTDPYCVAPIRAYNRDLQSKPVQITWTETIKGIGPGSCTVSHTGTRSITLPKDVYRRVFCSKTMFPGSFCSTETTYSKVSATRVDNKAAPAKPAAKKEEPPKGQNDHGGHGQ